MSNKKAIFPGSFDPFHKGHFTIVEEAAKLYDEVIVYVAHNPSKEYVLETQERANLIKSALSSLKNPNIKVMTQSENELTAEFAKKKGIQTIIRGLRIEATITPYESHLAELYLDENPDLIFHYIVSPFPYSSSQIKEWLARGENIEDCIPSNILQKVTKNYEKR